MFVFFFSLIVVGLRDGNLPSRGPTLEWSGNFYGIDNSGDLWIDSFFEKSRWIRPDSGGFDVGDVVGFGVEMMASGSNAVCQLFFTKNGARYGEFILFFFSIFNFDNSTGKLIYLRNDTQNVFPTVWMYHFGSKIEAIFELNDFKYDLRKHLSEIFFYRI